MAEIRINQPQIITWLVFLIFGVLVFFGHFKIIKIISAFVSISILLMISFIEIFDYLSRWR